MITTTEHDVTDHFGRNMTVPRTDLARVLREAADHLDKVGLHQGSMYRNDYDMLAERAGEPCCGWGAVDVVTSLLRERMVADSALSAMVGFRFPNERSRHADHFPYWNDEPGRTKEEVVEHMRLTADAVENATGPFARPERFEDGTVGMTA